jgi:hypothetical protein
MFLLEDGQIASDSGRPERTRRADTLIAVLFSAAVVFYVILSLLSAHSISASPVPGSQTINQAVAPVIGAASPGTW